MVLGTKKMDAGKTASSVHEVDLHVGARVRERRKAAGVSQIELAKKVGVTFQQVQKYERGHNRISASKLWEIGRVLHTPVGWFYQGMPVAVPEAAAQVQAFLETSEAIDLGMAFLALPTQNQKRCVVDLMKSMGLPS